MAGNAVSYAEDVLNVHEVWREAEDRLALHKQALDDRRQVRAEVRALQRKIADREADVAIDVRGKALGSEAKTELDRRTKQAIHDDPALQDMRAEMDDLKATEDMHDSEVKHHELGCNVLRGRMEQLGGLLHFYAAARSKST